MADWLSGSNECFNEKEERLGNKLIILSGSDYTYSSLNISFVYHF